jgi:hypothetical protein
MWFHGFHELTRERRDSAQLLDEIERGPFSGEQGAHAAFRLQDSIAHVQRGSVGAQRLHFGFRVDQTEGPGSGIDAGEHAGLLRKNPRPSALLGIDEKFAGHISRPHVLGQGKRHRVVSGIGRKQAFVWHRLGIISRERKREA